MADYRNGDTASWDTEQVRRGQSEQRSHQTTRRRKKKKRMNPLLYILLVLLLSALLAGVGWMLFSDFCAFNRGAKTTVTVEVTAEDSVSTVAEKLQDAGLIKYKWFFRLYAGISNADQKIGMGTYELNTDMDYHALIVGMRSSAGNMTAETVRVTIPEGYTVRQIIHLLPRSQTILVACRNKATGRLARLQCKTACVACGRCAKQCPSEAITIVEGVAQIDETKCTRCGACVPACPMHCIHNLFDENRA